MIDLEKTPVGGMTEWSAIDRQQRLTTGQLLMSALAAAATTAGRVWNVCALSSF
jgi:hypothetical protein